MSVATSIFLSGYLTLRTVSGICYAYDPIEDFDAAKFKGVWYELQRDVDIFFETGECVTAEYGDYDGDEANYVSIVNTQYFIEEAREDQIEGYAIANTIFGGKIDVYLSGSPVGADYRVIATDYDSYAIIYSCTQIGPVKFPEIAWVLTRDPIEEGSADFDNMMATVDPIFADKMPDYEKDSRMRTT